ncbi:MAG: glucose-6-phosphate isomerase [Gemmatimonadales bacterium]|nr:MAG: glucose-6-phosphate isomerase [Gemmatimonadales bacterium]
MTPVTLCYGNVLGPLLGPDRGPDPAALEAGGELCRRFEAAMAELHRRREAGELGFLDLPDDQALARQTGELADSFGQWFEAVVVVGIGGSGLGARALAEALLGPFWNERSDEERDHFPRLYFLENADPDTTRELLDRLDLRRTLFNVVSKSGGTAETLAQYLIIEDRLRSELGEEGVRGHLLFTTDPSTGPLRGLAGEREVPALPVPPNVGGRFSVLSPVGLLPAAVVGVDLDQLLDGARRMRDRCLTPSLRGNPAGLLATLLHAADVDRGQRVHVFMPYSDRLRGLALWFQQLWGESLGKRPTGSGSSPRRDPDPGAGPSPGDVQGPGDPGGVGPTPLAALGAVDQHSLLQLLMDGPRDKVVTFVRVRERDEPLPIPRSHPHRPALSRLGGHSLAELLDTELRATVEALRRGGRPSLTLEVDRLDAHSLGELFMLWQVAAVLAGALYGVNPLDQPGVELGKRLTLGLLDPGGEEGDGPPPDDPQWSV